MTESVMAAATGLQPKGGREGQSDVSRSQAAEPHQSHDGLPFEGLTPLSYDVIVCDPPWRFRTWGEHNQAKSASRHYALMQTEEIKALPVGSLAQRDCILLLWATGAMLPVAFDAMAAWGFTYKSMMVWRKLTPSGKVRMGTGYWARSMHEPVLIGSIGKPGKFSAFPSLFDGIAREHSRNETGKFAGAA